METIRERARHSFAPSAPAAPLNLDACRALSGYPQAGAPEIGSLPPVPPTWRGRLGAYGVRLVRRLLFWYTAQLRSAREEELAWRGASNRAIAELGAAAQAHETRLQGLQQALEQTSRLVAENADRLRRFEQQRAGLDDWPEAVRMEIERRRSARGAKPARRFRSYLPWVRESKAGSADRPLLDLGCGYGEWLALLRDEGLQASGVDSNLLLVEHCQRLNLEVRHADLVEHLRGLAARGCGMVTAFHVFEHLPAGAMLATIDEVSRVLRPRGFFIIETLNPENLFVATRARIEDPTRRELLALDLTEFLLENRGFEVITTRRLGKTPGKERLPKNGPTSRFLNDHFHGARNYSVVARKR